MTHDELLAKIDKEDNSIALFVGARTELADALRAVVELHKPYPSKPHKPDGVLLCRECTDYSTANWPCATVKAIEKGLDYEG